MSDGHRSDLTPAQRVDQQSLEFVERLVPHALSLSLSLVALPCLSAVAMALRDVGELI